MSSNTKKVYTTGEVAEICGVSKRTIIKCFDEGKLKGFKVPGARDRRIPRESLVDFMSAHQISLENLDPTPTALLLDPDADSAATFKAACESFSPPVEPLVAKTAVEAGMLLGRFDPRCFFYPDGLEGIEQVRNGHGNSWVAYRTNDKTSEDWRDQIEKVLKVGTNKRWLESLGARDGPGG